MQTDNSKIKDLTSLSKSKEILPNEFFHQLYENMPEMFALVDPKSAEIIECNSSLLEFTGYTKKELLGKHILDLYDDSCYEDVLQTLKKLSNGGIKEKELVFRKKDGNKLKVSMCANSVRDEDGNVVKTIKSWRDITQKREVEKELLASKIEAEKSDRLKSEFLTQISHEIRTPINTLLNFTSLIKSDLGDKISSDISDSFFHIDSAGKRIIRTIDLIVKMSELQTDNYIPNFQKNDIYDLLTELMDEFKLEAQEKGISLRLLKLTPNTKLVFDATTVKDIFRNLIDNAIKYTGKGFVKIYLKTELLNKTSVSVQDSGIGISENYINEIFKPFSQETSGYTRKFDGNGLGLALVKEYSNLNNAEIFVNSEKGSGSNFTVMFK